jgi:hypothetical protein
MSIRMGVGHDSLWVRWREARSTGEQPAVPPAVSRSRSGDQRTRPRMPTRVTTVRRRARLVRRDSRVASPCELTCIAKSTAHFLPYSAASESNYCRASVGPARWQAAESPTWTWHFLCGTAHMARLPEERRQRWTQRDRESVANYQRQWVNRPTIEEIREQHHDECSRIIRADKPSRRRCAG